MIQYIIGRLLGLLFSVLAISLILFVSVRWLPGTPWNEQDFPLQGAARENMLRKYGLDKPVWRQYTIYLWNLAHLDLGNSFVYRTDSVWKTIQRAWPATAKIGIITVAIALSVGMTLGILASLRQNTIFDYAVTLLATSGITVPNFAVAVWLVLFVAIYLDLTPTQGWARGST